MLKANYLVILPNDISLRFLLKLTPLFHSTGDLTYKSVLECLSIDTGNETRPPSITVTSCDDGSRILTHLGCLSSHNFHFNDSLWNYQVARFKFDGNIVITNLVHLRGTNALSLTGENITIDLNGVLKVDVNTVPSSHKETRLVGGFVSAIGANGSCRNIHLSFSVGEV